MTNRELRQALDERPELLDFARNTGVDEAIVSAADNAMSDLFYAVPCNDDLIPDSSE